MAKGTIRIDIKLCKGCNLCITFCKQRCIEQFKGQRSSEGYVVPSFCHEEDCTGCGVCGWMCPDMAITVYRYRN